MIFNDGENCIISSAINENQEAYTKKNSEELEISDSKKIIKMTNINRKCGNSFLDVFIRLTLFVVFIQFERTPAFKRIIHQEELYFYKNPMKPDIMPASYLLPSTFIIPFIVILTNYLITHDKYDFSQGNNVITLALALNGFLTSLLKITVGRPRPDFFYRCFPNGTINSNDDLMECLGDPWTVNEGRKSFPSGHSSFAFAGFGFMFLYIAAKLHVFNNRGRGQTWRLVVSLSPLVFAMLVAISRTCDYHHHFGDTFFGSILGFFVTFICYRQYYPSIFSSNPHKPFNFRLYSCNLVETDVTTCEENLLIKDDEKSTKWI